MERKMNENINTVDQVLTLTADIVAAHVSNHDVQISELPNIIEQVYTALAAVHDQGRGRPGRPTPAVAIKKSVTPDYIICLEDGKKLKMLKRHLKAVYGMSIQEYRERWGLPADYPTVAPNYAKQRSRLAKTIGLGTSRRLKKVSVA
jgi:predicted transcriptional regulator